MADTLLDGHCRRQAGDPVHIRPFQNGHVLTDIRRQTLQIPPLALGKEDIESQRRFSRTGHARHHHQLIAGDGYGDILQIVLPGAAHHNGTAPGGNQLGNGIRW